jgi:DNA repair ATPase RecN
MAKEVIKKKLNELLESFNSYERKSNRVLKNLSEIEEELKKHTKENDDLKKLWHQLSNCMVDMNNQLHNLNVDRAIINQIMEELEKNE